MLPSHDPVRVRAAHRRLATGLGVSAAVHVFAAALWLAAGPREAPDVPALAVYPPSFVLVDVSPEPDETIGRRAADEPTGGGDGSDFPDEAPPPPPAADAPLVARPTRAATAEAVPSEALSRTPVSRPSGPPVASPRTAAVPGAPGPPSSGPPGPTAGSGSGGPAGSGPGTGGGPGGTGGPGGGGGTAERFVERPERSPSGRTLGFPTYPPEAQRAGVGGRARFRLLVNSAGDVVEAEIIERTLIDRRGRERDVDVLPYGLENVLMDGARQSKFRPARDRGEDVRAYAFITLSAGVDG